MQSKHLGNTLKSRIARWLVQVESEQGCCWMMAFGRSMVMGENHAAAVRCRDVGERM